MSKTLLAGGTGLTLSTNTLNVDAAQTQITSVGTLTALTGGTGDFNWSSNTLVVDHSASKVGVGTAAPNALLDVAGRFQVTASGSSPSGGSGLEIYGGSTPVLLAYNRTGSAYLPLKLDGASYDIRTANTNRMTIDSSGNVGIGASPGTLLDIDGPDDSIVTYNFSGYGGGSARMKGHDKSLGGTTSSFNHTFAISLNTHGSNSGNGAERRHLAFYHEGWGSGDLACFYPEPSAGNQQVGIRTQTPGYTLGVDGDIGYSGSITDYSRRRIKENIEELDGSGFIDKFKKIPLYRFRYKPLVQKEELKDLAFREFGEKVKDEILYTEEEGLEEGITAGQVKEPAEWKWDKWEGLFPNGYGESKLFDCPDAELKTFLDEKAEELRSTRRTDYHQKHQLQLGLIADDKVLAENFPEVLAYREFTEEGRDDEVWGIKTTAYIGMLHGVLKEAITRIETLENA